MTGPKIADARKAAGLTQAELAKRARTSQSAINRYEHGRVTPRKRTLERLLDACRRPLRPSEVLTAHRQEILSFARQHGASKVMVFGSVARGEDDYGSDLDLLMDIPTTYSLFGLTRLQLELSSLLGIHVDLGSVDDLRPRTRDEVLRDARPL
ncbi:MAG TPA: helix-turn-helix domain-containing protein [Candidatus Dormibacteraeota bacterium]|jgi:hypothetical protein|nr:helix-turn-helix domain-containing protein [Candidatus Dormibacteraeota bacterium]